jgi:hypothetical protein
VPVLCAVTGDDPMVMAIANAIENTAGGTRREPCEKRMEWKWRIEPSECRRFLRE